MDVTPLRLVRGDDGVAGDDALADPRRRALLVTSMYTEGDLAKRLGRDAYSYRYVYRAFAPLLERWAATREVSGPAAQLPAAVERARREGKEPVHLSFLPLHLMSKAEGVANVGVPAWEFPEIPQTDVAGDPRNNWARLAGELDLIVTHTHYSRDAFRRAGVRTPVHVVPVPIDPAYFDVPPWEAGRKTVIDCPCYVFPQASTLPRAPRPWVDAGTGHLPTRPGLRSLCKRAVKALPARLSRPLFKGFRAARAAARAARATLRAIDVRTLYPPRPQLELSGIVYTTIFNPFDGRKNWLDLLSGYLIALRDCPDATLVVKLVVSAEMEADALGEVFTYYRDAGLSHRCKVVFVTSYLSDEQLVQLTRASACYLNTSHAEGSCLPLQNFMAAGRPAVAPPNTGMADSLDEHCGYLIDSHPEPTSWPIDLHGGLTTRWYRLVWQSLHDRLQASYETARHQPGLYQTVAAAARSRMKDLASRESVWPRLAAALDEVQAAHESRLTRRAG
jgi:glycosyltransferase involved in cell wall biosynthesis